MQHRNDRNGLWLVNEIDGVRELVQQGTPHVFTYYWKAKRIIGNVFE